MQNRLIYKAASILKKSHYVRQIDNLRVSIYVSYPHYVSQPHYISQPHYVTQPH